MLEKQEITDKLIGIACAASTSSQTAQEVEAEFLEAFGDELDQVPSELSNFAKQVSERGFVSVHGNVLKKPIKAEAKECVEAVFTYLGSLHIDKPLAEEKTAKHEDEEESEDAEMSAKTFGEDGNVQVAEFDLAPSTNILDGHVVYPNSFLFETGDYPDKDFSLSEQEMENAVNYFRPGDAPLDLQHISTPLDGKLGEVVDIRKIGNKLFGSVRISKWLDAVLPEKKRVSCTWDKKAKKLVGLALVNTPRIEDAALMAAFSAYQDDETNKKGNHINMAGTVKYEDNPMQKHHDMAVMGGAECPGCAGFSEEEAAKFKEDKAEFITPELLKSIQKMHDSAAGSGADCNQFANRMRAGMTPAHMAYTRAGFSDEEKAKFEEEKTKAVSEVTTQFEGKLAEMSTVLNSLTAEIKATKHDAAVSDACNFLDGLVSEFKLTPAEKDAWTKKIKDEDSGLTIFEGSRDILEARPRLSHAPEKGTTRTFKADSAAYSADGGSKVDIVEMANALAKEKGINFIAAFEQVRKDNPDAEREYAATRPVNGMV